MSVVCLLSLLLLVFKFLLHSKASCTIQAIKFHHLWPGVAYCTFCRYSGRALIAACGQYVGFLIVQGVGEIIFNHWHPHFDSTSKSTPKNCGACCKTSNLSLIWQNLPIDIFCNCSIENPFLSKTYSPDRSQSSH